MTVKKESKKEDPQVEEAPRDDVRAGTAAYPTGTEPDDNDE